MEIYGTEKQYEVNGKKEKTEVTNSNLNALQKKMNGKKRFVYMLF